MSEQAFHDSWWLFTRARGTGLVLRAAILVSPVAVLACIRAASSSSALVALEVFVVALTLVCVVLPDSHVGMVVSLLLGLGWLVGVSDVTSPWSFVAALALLVFHSSLAAASVAAPAAAWTPAMRRRWLCRVGVVGLASVAVWVLVAAVNQFQLGSSAALVVAALVVLAVGGLWASDVTVARRAPRSRASATPPSE